MKNKWNPMYFIAFKERKKNGDIHIVIHNDVQYYHSKEEAEKSLEDFKEENYYQDNALEVIKLWQKQNNKQNNEN